MALPLSFKIPGAYITLVLGAGTQSPLNAPKKVLVVDYGTAGPLNVPTPVASADEAGLTFGYRSHLYRAAVAFFDEYATGTLYLMRYAEAGGGTAQAKTITVTGTATGTGSIFIDINGLAPIEVTVTTGDVQNATATALAAAVTARTQYPVTAAAATNDATFTWAQKGLRSTQFKLRATMSASLTGVTLAIADTTAGATDGSYATALAAIGIDDYDFIVTGADTSDATTGIAPFVTLVNTRSGPTIGLRGVVVAASSDSFGTATALSLALNAFRLQIAWFRNADSLTVETASKVAAWRAYWEGQDPARNFDYQAFENLRGPYSTTDRISVVEANNALNSGLTPIGINRAGKAFMWRSITSRFQDTNGGPDYRVLDTSKVAVVDYIADFLASDYLVKGYQSMKLRDDSGDQRPQTGVITPKIIRSWIVGVLKGAENNDPILLENVDAHLNELEVKLSTVVPGRMEARIPLDVIEGFHQLDMTLLQIG